MVFFLGLFLTVTAFSFGQVERTAKDQKTQQKKEQRVKVVVNQDGKEIRIDTTFNFADDKLVQFKVDSILEKYGKDGMAKGDHKVIVLRGGKIATIDNVGDEMMMPPPPAPPPPFHMRSFNFAGGDPFAMDPNNKDIISYDKKDIGKGLEKITIVRKKRVSNDE